MTNDGAQVPKRGRVAKIIGWVFVVLAAMSIFSRLMLVDDGSSDIRAFLAGEMSLAVNALAVAIGFGLWGLPAFICGGILLKHRRRSDAISLLIAGVIVWLGLLLTEAFPGMLATTP